MNWYAQVYRRPSLKVGPFPNRALAIDAAFSQWPTAHEVTSGYGDDIDSVLKDIWWTTRQVWERQALSELLKK